MAGTRMSLRRYAPVSVDWRPIEYIVDQQFIDDNGLMIPIPYDYEVGLGLLDVYYRGEYLLSGGGYEELDGYIRLDLGTDPQTGVPFQLEVGDEIFIKVWSNQYCSRGGNNISRKEFYDLQKEVFDARKFRYDDTPFPSLDARLDYIQRSIELIENGLANVDIEYEHNDKNQITKQIITGDYTLTREFTFNNLREIETETITLEDGFKVQKTNEYTVVNDVPRLLRTRVRVL